MHHGDGEAAWKAYTEERATETARRLRAFGNGNGNGNGDGDGDGDGDGTGNGDGTATRDRDEPRDVTAGVYHPPVVDLSVILPVFDEAESLPQLARELESALSGMQLSWEVIFVDDGSRDGSAEVLRTIVAGDSRFRILTFAQNRGQSAALAAGMIAARGATVVTLDADLQNDPRDIPKLLERMSESGADVVSGIRVRRRDTVMRRFASAVANRVRNLVLHDGVTDAGCSLKAYRAEYLRDLPAFDGLHRFLPAIVRARGARIVEIGVSHRPRRYGRSKYGIAGRFRRGVHDLIGVRWLLSRQLDLKTDEEPSSPRSAGGPRPHPQHRTD